MELRELIELGANKAGSVAALGRILDLTREATTQAKSHKRKLPTDAVIKLADYIGVELRVVTAANELVTEKDEAKRRFYAPFVEHAKAASIAAALAIALVTNFVTPTPAQAAPLQTTTNEPLCIMLIMV